MKLRELISRLQRPLVDGDAEREVGSVSADSHAVEPGAVFVAVRGTQVDGRKFIQPAVEAGAVAVVSESARETGDPEGVTWIQVADSRAALSALAAGIHADPAAEMKLVGVTGTNGKTTTVFLCHHILKTVWHRAGMLGTVHVDDGEARAEASHTTPDAVALHAILRRMADHGCRGAALEVSSHGIDQKRVADLAFDALVFTNLSQDHLDYHGTMEAYAEAKMSWFDAAAVNPRGKKPVAVVHADDPRGHELVERLRGRLPVVRFGFGIENDLRAIDFRQSARGSEFKLATKGRSYLVRTPLIGRFNALNALAALAAAKAVGIPLRSAISALAEVPQVPGRLEHCGSRDGVNVFVDYAHSPDALEHVCRTLRELEPRRLLTVFGCGGDRDRAKRPLMAKAAASYSDACILTSDNPRSEDPEKILRQVEAGMGNARYRVVTDRAEAIRIAVHAAGAGDIVLIAGKGHETYQQFADRTISFDDRSQARIAIRERPEPEEGERK